MLELKLIHVNNKAQIAKFQVNPHVNNSGASWNFEDRPQMFMRIKSPLS